MLGQLRARVPARPGDLGLLGDEPELVGQRERVVGADLGPEPVLERGDDPAPVGVVLRVGARHQHDVERQPERVAAHPDVALLEHVEQRHLDALGQVGQLVEAEDAAVGARHHAEVDGLRVAEGPSLGHLDRVDVADQVADAGVRGGELLAVPLAAVLPADREVLALLRARRRQRAHTGAYGWSLISQPATAGRPLVEQAADRADEPGLALAALAQQDDVVPGEQGALHVRQHGLVETDDAGEAFLPGAHPRQQVLSDLLLDRAIDVAARPQLAQCGRLAVRSACVGMIAALLHPSDTMSGYRVFASWGGPGGR